MKHLVGKVMSKKTKFMGEDVTIKKLSVSQVMEIQEKSKAVGEDENASIQLLQYVISCAVDGADELSTEDFSAFPVDELSRLSNEVLTFSGLGNVSQAKYA
jgi:hypothetical protein